jgi:hypothetical protein
MLKKDYGSQTDQAYFPAFACIKRASLRIAVLLEDQAGH